VEDLERGGQSGWGANRNETDGQATHLNPEEAPFREQEKHPGSPGSLQEAHMAAL